MKQKVVIHDLEAEAWGQLHLETEDCIVVAAREKAAGCQGCFGCWLKTPGQCVYRDRLQNVGAVMAQSREIILITRSCYGGYSPQVKRVLDRSISASLPFFTYRAGKIHHPLRYKPPPRLTVYLYGEQNEMERQIAAELVQANGINLGCEKAEYVFLNDPVELKEIWA